jgi:hypothetical protein
MNKNAKTIRIKINTKNVLNRLLNKFVFNLGSLDGGLVVTTFGTPVNRGGRSPLSNSSAEQFFHQQQEKRSSSITLSVDHHRRSPSPFRCSPAGGEGNML